MLVNFCPSPLWPIKMTEVLKSIDSLKVNKTPSYELITTKILMQALASKINIFNLFLYPPQRGYISFVNTLVTP